jgi:hypothetical protein
MRDGDESDRNVPAPRGQVTARLVPRSPTYLYWVVDDPEMAYPSVAGRLRIDLDMESRTVGDAVPLDWDTPYEGEVVSPEGFLAIEAAVRALTFDQILQLFEDGQAVAAERELQERGARLGTLADQTARYRSRVLGDLRSRLFPEVADPGLVNLFHSALAARWTFDQVLAAVPGLPGDHAEPGDVWFARWRCDPNDVEIIGRRRPDGRGHYRARPMTVSVDWSRVVVGTLEDPAAPVGTDTPEQAALRWRAAAVVVTAPTGGWVQAKGPSPERDPAAESDVQRMTRRWNSLLSPEPLYH